MLLPSLHQTLRNPSARSMPPDARSTGHKVARRLRGPIGIWPSLPFLPMCLVVVLVSVMRPLCR